MSNKSRIFITVAIVVLVIAAIYYGLVLRRGGELAEVELSQEVLRSLTPPEGAEPIELSSEVLKSLTPPEGAAPVELSPKVLRSLTP